MAGTSEYTPPLTGQGTSAPAYAPTQGVVGGGFGNQPSAPQLGNLPGQFGNLQAFGDLWNTVIGGPSQAMGDYQVGNLQDQLGLLFASGQYQADLAQQQAGYAMQNLGLDNAALGVQQGALNRQNALMPQQQALVDQVFGIQQGALDRQGVLLPQQQALVDAAFGRNTAQLANSADQAHRSTLSAATARGAVGSEGDLNRERQIDVNQMYSQAGLNDQNKSSHLSYDEQLAALKDSNAYLANQEAAQHLSYQERLAQNADAQKMLDISGKRLGISGQEVQSRLEGALNQLGISTSLGVDQLMSEVNKIQEGQLSPLSNLIGQIYSLAGIPLPGQDTAPAPTGQSNRVIQGVS